MQIFWSGVLLKEGRTAFHQQTTMNAAVEQCSTFFKVDSFKILFLQAKLVNLKQGCQS